MTNSQKEAQDLAYAIAQGDRRALARLITLYGPGIRRYAAQALTVPADAEDVAQDVFFKAWNKAEQYDPSKGAVSTWLYRIAVNLCIDRNRRTRFRRFVGLEAVAEITDDTPAPETNLMASQELSRVRDAISALPSRQKRAILLRTAGDRSVRDIAEILETSEGAVEQLLVRARSTLRQAIDT